MDDPKLRKKSFFAKLWQAMRPTAGTSERTQDGPVGLPPQSFSETVAESAKAETNSPSTNAAAATVSEYDTAFAAEVQGIAIPWGTVFHHLSRQGDLVRGILGDVVITIGSGPWPGDVFEEFLDNCGINTCSADEFSDSVAVVGQTDWSKDTLVQMVKAHPGGPLYVYSQEMVLASLALGIDVFEVCSREELLMFADGHKALEFLAYEMSDWLGDGDATLGGHPKPAISGHLKTGHSA